MAQQPKVVKVGPGGRSNGPRPKVENPGKVFKRILAYVMNRYKAQVIVVLCCILLAVFAQLQGVMFSQTLIDGYILPLLKAGSTDFSGLAAAILRVAVIYCIGIAAIFLQNRLMARITQGTLKDLRDEMFTHMQTLPIKYFDTHAHGDIMSVYTNDTDTLRQMISQSLPQLVNTAVTLVGVLASMIYLSIPLTVLALAMVGVMLLATKYLTGNSGKYFIKQQQELGKVNGYIEEMMNGQKVIKVFCHEEIAIEEFDRLNDELFHSADKANSYSLVAMPVNGQLGNLSYVFCAILGGALAINAFGGLTLGGLASFLVLTRQFNQPISQISMQLNSVVMALAGGARIFALLDEKPEVNEGDITLVHAKYAADDTVTETNESTGMWAWKRMDADGKPRYTKLEGDIVFKDVDFGYDEKKIVLHDINLYGRPGQKIAFVGSTGAGKTTITNLINRFYDIQKGQILIDGIDIKHIKISSLRRHFGQMLQDVFLFAGDIRSNIVLRSDNVSDEEVWQACRYVNADSFIKKLEGGLNETVREQGNNFSAGQRQLLSFARTILHKPSVMILDEATANIDTETEVLIQDSLEKMKNIGTMLIVAHRLSTIQHADNIIVLSHGQIMEQGTHQQLLHQKGRYYQLYTLQFQKQQLQQSET